MTRIGSYCHNGNLCLLYIYIYSPVGSQDDNNVIHQLGSQETTDQANGHLRISREQKNERERTRIRKKGDLLAELQQIIKRSHLIRSDTKRKRFTEVTIKLTFPLTKQD